MLAIVARGLLLVSLVWLGVVAGPGRAAPGWLPESPIGVGLIDRTPFLAADLTPAGAATVVWRGSTGGHPAILATARAPAGGYSDSVVVSRGTTEVGRPALAVSRHGVAVATWAQIVATGRWVVQAALRSPDGAWSAPEPISGPTDDPPEPSAAIADDGQAVVIWLGSQFATSHLVQVASHPHGGAWTVAQNLSATNRIASEQHEVIDHQGNATAVWLQVEPNPDNTTTKIVFTSERPAGAAWSGAQPRTDSSLGDAHVPHLAAR